MHQPFILALVALGCRANGDYLIHPNAAWAIDERPTTAAAHDPDYLIVADTHASFPLAPHDLESNTYVIDVVGHAAVRPPQVDLWSDRILEWIVGHWREANRVVHLGDAANIACATEFRRFLDTIKSAKHWIYTPGNHDSLLMGNFADWVLDPRAETRWGRECGQLPVLTKTRLLKMYIEAKKWSFDPESVESKGITARLGHDGIDRLCSLVATDDDTVSAIRCDIYLRDKCKNLVRDEHQKLILNEASAFYSFIVQLVADDKQDLLLLDSTDFRQLPRIPRRPGGIYGGISDLQLAAAKWLIEHADEKRGHRNPILIGSHFPIDALDEASLVALERFLGEQRVFAFVGAHAHLPTAGRRHSTPNHHDFLELNVGSAAGWPMEYQYFTIDVNAGGDLSLTTKVVSVARALLQNRLDLGVLPIESCGQELLRQVPQNAYYGYKHYYRPHGYLKLVRAMFAEEDKFLESIKLSEYRADEELAGLAPKVIAPMLSPMVLADVERYERCQAVFASAAESEDVDVDLGLAITNHDLCTGRPKQKTQCQASFFSKREDPAPERCECRVLQEGAAVGTRTWHLAATH